MKYVVLRWFDTLPQIDPSEDVDILIADESLPAALEVLHSQPGIQLCDVYSESGLPRSDYCGVAYYPPGIARRILEGATRHRDLCYVPNPADYFNSLSFHAVYHKGVRSGLPTRTTGLECKRDPEHDYAAILQSMAHQLGIRVDVSLPGLHTYLQTINWGPTPDALARLAAACPRNRWLQLLAGQLPAAAHDQGLGVFVLRKEAVRRGFKNKMTLMIRNSGFEILVVKDVKDGEALHTADRIRGGNWSAGPYALSGGPPAAAVIVYDPNIIPLNRKQRKRFPQRTNARLFVKEKIRDAIAADLPSNQQFNALHSSDHAAEAWHLIDVLCPELADEIRARVGTPKKSAETKSLNRERSGRTSERESAPVQNRSAA